jgi:hypothetical protein
MLKSVAVSFAALAGTYLPQIGVAQAQTGSYYPQPSYAAPAQPGYGAQARPGYGPATQQPSYGAQGSYRTPTQPGYGAASYGSTPQGAAATQYDGTYMGVLQLTNVGAGCSQGAPRRINVSNGMINFVFNPQRNTVLTGSVRPDGSFTATGTQNGGQVNASGRVQGTSLNGQVATSSCSYNIAMQKGRQ